MANHASIIGYFFQAGLVVKTVMFLLLCASIASWTLIFQRALFFRQKRADSKRFERRFWESGDLGKLYTDLDTRVEERHGLAAIFHAGFREFVRCRKQGNTSLESITRAMQIGHAKEAEALEAGPTHEEADRSRTRQLCGVSPKVSHSKMAKLQTADK